MIRSLLLAAGLWVAAMVPLDAQQPFTCPTTASTNPPPFFAPAPYSVNPPWPEYFWYGSEALWTMLRHDGTWSGLHVKNSEHLAKSAVYRNKVFMWRQGYDWRTEQRPALTLTARRLDGDSPAVVVREATNAHAEDIGSAMLTAAVLPAAGCWEFTAHYGRRILSFVVSVP